MLFRRVVPFQMLVGLLLIGVAYVRTDAADAADAAIARGGTAHHTHYLSPVQLSEACQDPAYYCVYLNQNYRAVVDISPFYGSDNQGGFLFARSQYLSSSDSHTAERAKLISVCYGGCCIDVSFSASNGCVSMVYRNVPAATAKGHLLGHFADHTDRKIGPKPDMMKSLYACPSPQDDNPAPFTVIEARYRKGMAFSSQQRSGSSPGYSVRPL